MEQNLVLEALKFMVLGMGVVFLFLIVMVYAIKVQAFLINKFFPEKGETNDKKIQKQPTNVSDTSKKIAAITAAIQHHNNLKG